MNKTVKRLLRLLTLALCCVLLVSVFTACSKKPASGSADPGTNNQTPGNNPNPGKDEAPYEVILHYMYWTIQPTEEATAAVEELVNKRLAELGVNATLKIKFLGLMEYSTQMDLMLASGEKCDIIFGGLAGLAPMVANGYLAPLDAYVNTALADAAEMLGPNWMETGKVGGVQYGIPNYKGAVMNVMYQYQKSYIDGIGYDMTKVNSFADTEDLYAALHAAYPDKYLDFYYNWYYNWTNMEAHTAILNTFGATIGDDPTVVSYFETDAWKTAIDYAWKYRSLGYVNPEGSMQPDFNINMYIGQVNQNGRDEAAQAALNETLYGGEFGSKSIGLRPMESMGIEYGIAYTSQNVEAAARVLNYIWTDSVIANALIYGIEGRDYILVEPSTEAGPGVYAYPDGKNADDLPFALQMNDGIFTNEFLLYRGKGMSLETRQFMKDNMENAWVVPLFGFTAETGDIANALAACNNVYGQYYDALCYGQIDPATNDEYVTALKTAGLGTVLENLNQQVQSWLATK